MSTSFPATTPDIVKDARQLYLAYKKATAKPIKAENLDKVWEVLEAIHEDGSRDYSIAEVGRRLQKIGGPKTQSLRNAQGAHFREIITAYAYALSGSTRYVAKNKSNVEHALDLISDPSIRATIRVALDEAKRLKVVNDNLHAAFKTLQVGTSLGQPVPATEASPVQLMAPQANTELTPRLLDALRKGIDETRLAQQGLHIGADGSIENDHSDKVFPPAFVLAVRVLLTERDK
jgi:hypothetical protein